MACTGLGPRRSFQPPLTWLPPEDCGGVTMSSSPARGRRLPKPPSTTTSAIATTLLRALLEAERDTCRPLLRGADRRPVCGSCGLAEQLVGHRAGFVATTLPRLVTVADRAFADPGVRDVVAGWCPSPAPILWTLCGGWCRLPWCPADLVRLRLGPETAAARPRAWRAGRCDPSADEGHEVSEGIRPSAGCGARSRRARPHRRPAARAGAVDGRPRTSPASDRGGCSRAVGLGVGPCQHRAAAALDEEGQPVSVEDHGGTGLATGPMGIRRRGPAAAPHRRVGGIGGREHEWARE